MLGGWRKVLRFRRALLLGESDGWADGWMDGRCVDWGE